MFHHHKLKSQPESEPFYFMFTFSDLFLVSARVFSQVYKMNFQPKSELNVNAMNRMFIVCNYLSLI